MKHEGYDLDATHGVRAEDTVCRATEKTGRVIAIKILNRMVSEGKHLRARFRREIAILQRVKHPNKIEFYGCGENDGLLFHVMELVEGRSVKDLLRQSERVSWEEVVLCAEHVCSELQLAHHNGILCWMPLLT